MTDMTAAKQELRDAIDATRDLFSRKGWTLLHKSWEEELTALEASTLADCTTLEELHYRKGVRTVLHRLVNLAAYLDNIEKALEANEDE